jgi:hypothetical protein
VGRGHDSLSHKQTANEEIARASFHLAQGYPAARQVINARFHFKVPGLQRSANRRRRAAQQFRLDLRIAGKVSAASRGGR